MSMQADMRYRDAILQGDALAVLRTLPDGIVQTCVTSPPYFGLRSYLADGDPDKPKEIGLEATPEAYVARMVAVFREVRRCLRDDGTLWLNIGDSYAGSWGNYSGENRGKGTQRGITVGSLPSPAWEGREHERPAASRALPGIKPKDLVGIPWLLAFALRADGWWLRADIIWAKPNPMPESVRDRPTKSHEYLFLLTKQPRYYYDADAIREDAAPQSLARIHQPNFANQTGGPKDYRATGINPNRSMRQTLENFAKNPGRNKRSVWTVSTRPYAGAHFATFPPALVEPCVLAGSPPRCCEVCGASWRRVTVRTGHVNRREPAHVPGNTPTKTDSTGWAPVSRGTGHWQPTCRCPGAQGTARPVVLDPFMGSGTVGAVAKRHSRHYLGVELNPDYIALAERRIAAEVQPVLWSAVAQQSADTEEETAA